MVARRFAPGHRGNRRPGPPDLLRQPRVATYALSLEREQTPINQGPEGAGSACLRATAISVRPGHGISLSKRLQSQTVLSKILSTALLMSFRSEERRAG